MTSLCVTACADDLDQILELMRAYYAFDGLVFDEAPARGAVRDSLTTIAI